MIRNMTEIIERHEGRRPAGWMSPWLSCSEGTPDLLQEAGYRYFMGWTCDDQPIWLATRSGRILAMPDTRAVVWFRYTSAEFADMIVMPSRCSSSQKASHSFAPSRSTPLSSGAHTGSDSYAAHSATLSAIVTGSGSRGRLIFASTSSKMPTHAAPG